MRFRPRVFAAALLVLVMAGCAAPDPYFQRTRLKPLSASEREMECQQIDLAIDRADTVRWVLRDFGATLQSSGVRTLTEAGNLLVLFPMLLFGASPTSIMEHGSGHYALDAADVRIRELLQLKRARGCTARATMLPGMNDNVLLAQLEMLQAKLDASTEDEVGLLKERTRLLDGLRIVPPPAAAKRRQTTDPPDKQD